MPKRRTDIYFDANRLILKTFRGENLKKITHLYALESDERHAFLVELHALEHALAKKYGVQLDTVRSQTAEIIRTLRTNMKG